MRNTINIFVGKPEGKVRFWDPMCQRKIKLKWMQMKCGVIVWIGFIWLRMIGLILGSCGVCNGSCELHKRLKMAWIAEQLLVYQDIFCFTKLPSYHKLVHCKLGFQYVAPTSWCLLNTLTTPAWTLKIVAGRRFWWVWNVCNVMIMNCIFEFNWNGKQLYKCVWCTDHQIRRRF